MRSQVLDALLARPPADPVVLTPNHRIDAGAVLDHARAVAEAIPQGGTIASIGLHGPALIAADLGAIWSGARLVPLPAFFSPAQIGHALEVSGANALLVEPEGLATRLAPTFRGLRINPATRRPVGQDQTPGASGHERVIFTSGTTGRPKGVRQGLRQLEFMARALGQAVDARADDLHFACLPLAQLLEQVAGLHLPILARARVGIAPGAMEAALNGRPAGLFTALAEMEATTTIVVPRLLAAWVALLEAGVVPAPKRLRLVAVGGAPVSPGLVRRARALGLPVAVGYGLSECCSVVALGTPDDDPATVGRPLEGITLSVEDGEIVVRCPGVMTGYLGQPPLAERVWRSGDLGRLDPAGFLRVEGRRDTVLVLPNGRNLAPEWVEEAFETLPGVARALATSTPDGTLAVGLVHAGPGTPAAPPRTDHLGLPPYALPELLGWFSPAEAEALGLRSPDRRAARTGLCAAWTREPDRFTQAA